jgi:Ca-activated chloride channel family protein
VSLESAAAPKEGRKKLNIALVLDRSGSMQGEKLEYVKSAAKLFVGQLEKGDMFSLTVFDDQIHSLIPNFVVGRPNNAESMFDAIRHGGRTNLAGGYLKGHDLALKNKSDDRVSRVILLTDGLANVGITDPMKLAAIAAEKQSAGITTSTIGVGEGYDEVLLGKMAENGGGSSYLIETPDDAPEVFREELGYLQSLVATDLQVRFLPAHRDTRVGQLNTFRASDGGTYLLGDVYSGQQKSIVLALETAELEVGQKVFLGTLHVSFRDVTSMDSAVETREIPMVIDVLSEAELGAVVPDRDVTLAASFLLIARAIKEAVRYADQGDFEKAAEVLEKQVKELKALNLGDRQLDEEIEDMRKRAQNFRNHREDYYSAMERKRIYMASYHMSSNRMASLDSMKRRMAAREQQKSKRKDDGA